MLRLVLAMIVMAQSAPSGNRIPLTVTAKAAIDFQPGILSRKVRDQHAPSSPQSWLKGNVLRRRLRHCSMRLLPCWKPLQHTIYTFIVAGLLTGWSQEGSGIDYRGQVRFGGYQSSVTLNNDLSGLGTNDASIASTRFDLELTRLNRNRDQFVIELRDKYDFFGKSNNELLQLEADNRLDIRELRYERPWQNNRLYYSLGRFPLAEANIFTHDGAELGYRLSRNHRIGVFGGIANQDVFTPAYLEADFQGYNGVQVGAYSLYETHQGGRSSSSYMSNAVAQGPTVELADVVNKVYYFHLGNFNLSSAHRLRTQANMDIQPSASLRRAHIGYQYFSRVFRVSSYITRISPEDYRLKKEVRDALVASTLDSLGLQVLHRLSTSLSLEYGASTARRTADRLDRTDLNAGVRYRGLLRGRLAVGGLIGLRDNYLSDDNYLRASLDYYSDLIYISSYIQLFNEDYAIGTQLNGTTVYGELGFYLSELLRGSMAYTQSQDQLSSIQSFFLMIGYTFGDQSTSPIRRLSPRFESL